MRKHKIPIEKVQEAFNDAIKRRDGRCIVRDYEPCCGQLECSHFYSVGSTPGLRFHPANAWTQCTKHHWNHHNAWKEEDSWSYTSYMKELHAEDLQNLESLRFKSIKYTDELKAEIISLCNADRLDDLRVLVERELGPSALK